jgi:hypothetical protein
MPPPSLDLTSFSLPFFFSIQIGILGLKVRGKGRRQGGRWGMRIQNTIYGALRGGYRNTESTLKSASPKNVRVLQSANPFKTQNDVINSVAKSKNQPNRYFCPCPLKRFPKTTISEPWAGSLVSSS